MEFDKSKILTCVTGSKDLIGKMGWFADSPIRIADNVISMKPTELILFDENDGYPFKNKQGYPSVLFYPAQEPTHEELFEEWIRENDVKEGTHVKVVKHFGADVNSGIVYGTDDGKKKYIYGSVGTIDKLCTYCADVKFSDGKVWDCPHTALEVVKEEKQEDIADTLNEAQKEYLKKCVEKENVIFIENITESLKENGINPITIFSVIFDAVLKGKEFDKLRGGNNGK